MTARNDTTDRSLLIHISEQRLEESSRRLSKLVGRRDEACTKLQMLTDHGASYHEQLEGAKRVGIEADGQRNFQSFVATLERATEQQSDLIVALQILVADAEGKVRHLQRKIHSHRVMQDRNPIAARMRASA